MPKNSEQAGKITRITPQAAIAGGEIFIECENFPVRYGSDVRCYLNNAASFVTAASSRRVIAIMPDDEPDQTASEGEIRLVCDEQPMRDNYKIKTARKLTEDLHLVASPAFDPDDNRLIVTRSGSRGQH